MSIAWLVSKCLLHIRVIKLLIWLPASSTVKLLLLYYLHSRTIFLDTLRFLIIISLWSIVNVFLSQCKAHIYTRHIFFNWMIFEFTRHWAMRIIGLVKSTARHRYLRKNPVTSVQLQPKPPYTATNPLKPSNPRSLSDPVPSNPRPLTAVLSLPWHSLWL